jgi:hypothetical protein
VNITSLIFCTTSGYETKSGPVARGYPALSPTVKAISFVGPIRAGGGRKLDPHCRVVPRMAREMRMTYDHIRVTPLATHVGAEISGVDLAGAPGGAELAEIRRALGEYGVVFFREQQLTPEQHIAFARSFGEIDVNRFFATVPGYPMIAEVRKEPER